MNSEEPITLRGTVLFLAFASFLAGIFNGDERWLYLCGAVGLFIVGWMELDSYSLFQKRFGKYSLAALHLLLSPIILAIPYVLYFLFVAGYPASAWFLGAGALLVASSKMIRITRISRLLQQQLNTSDKTRSRPAPGSMPFTSLLYINVLFSIRKLMILTMLGLFIVAIIQISLNLTMFSGDDAVVRKTEQMVSLARSYLTKGVASYSYIVLAVFAVVLLGLLPSIRIPERIIRLRPGVEALLTVLYVISCFSFFSARGLEHNLGNWVARLKSDVSNRELARSAEKEQRWLLAAVVAQNQLADLSEDELVTITGLLYQYQKPRALARAIVSDTPYSAALEKGRVPSETARTRVHSFLTSRTSTAPSIGEIRSYLEKTPTLNAELSEVRAAIASEISSRLVASAGVTTSGLMEAFVSGVISEIAETALKEITPASVESRFNAEESARALEQKFQFSLFLKGSNGDRHLELTRIEREFEVAKKNENRDAALLEKLEATKTKMDALVQKFPVWEPSAVREQSKYERILAQYRIQQSYYFRSDVSQYLNSVYRYIRIFRSSPKNDSEREKLAQDLATINRTLDDSYLQPKRQLEMIVSLFSGVDKLQDSAPVELTVKQFTEHRRIRERTYTPRVIKPKPVNRAKGK